MITRIKTNIPTKHRKKCCSSNKKKYLTKKQIKQHGGKVKDNFEITTLQDIDPKKFSISQYMNANVDWGNLMPGPPPTDCIIM